METVKEFKDAGLEFVDGDKCKEDSLELEFDWLHDTNEGDNYFDSCLVTCLAWRTNTGEKPSFSGDIEVEFRGGYRFKDCCDCFDWLITGAENDIIKWRPVISKEDKMEGKTNEPIAYAWIEIPERAPTYTKEMHEASEFNNGDKVYSSQYPGAEFIYIGKHPESGHVAFALDVEQVVRVACRHISIKPIDTRTDEEKLVDEACAEMIAIDATPIDTSEKAIIELMIKAGYRKP